MSGQPERSNPWMKFYPADWRSDPGLSMCGAAARGVWMELICLMAGGPVYGDLILANGKQPTMQQLSVLTRLDVQTVADALVELEENGVFSRRDDGRIYSRRMTRDHKQAEANKVNGRKGGNPNLKPKENPPVNPTPTGGLSGGDNPTATGGLTGGVKAQKLEARSQSLETRTGGTAQSSHSRAHEEAPPPNGVRPFTPASSDPPDTWGHLCDGYEDDKRCDPPIRRPVVGGVYLDLAAGQVERAARLDPARWTGTWQPLIAWIRQGFDVEKHVLPAIHRCASRPGYTVPGTLAYFNAAVAEERQRGAA